MEKVEKAARISAIRSYLKGIGLEVSNVQAHEVLARALGLKNKHVLEAKVSKEKGKTAEPHLVMGKTSKTISLGGTSVEVLPVGAHPLSVKRLEELGWEVDVIIPVPLEHVGDIEVLNSYASQFTTGNEAALEGICYEHMPHIAYESGYAAQRVTGYISAPEDHFDVSSEDEVRFYQNLSNLCILVQAGQPVKLQRGGQEVICTMDFVDSALLTMLDRYAASRGANNDEMNELSAHVALTLWPHGQPFESRISVSLGELKYAYLTSSNRFQVCAASATYYLDFAV